MKSKILLFVIYIEINSAPIVHRDGEENRRCCKNFQNYAFICHFHFKRKYAKVAHACRPRNPKVQRNSVWLPLAWIGGIYVFDKL
jgi:hypothetical protein